MKKNLCKILASLLILLSFSCKSTPKRDKNFLGDFNAVNLDKMMAAIVPRTKSELSPREISFVFEPKTNILSFHHKYMGDNIWISLNYEERQTMIAAINAYLEAFKKGELTAENNKKKAFFGKTPSYMRWGLLGLVHEAKPALRFEYQLMGQKQLPYFILATASQKALGNDEANSIAIRIALSPAKCQEFLLRLDQNNLLEIVNELQADFEKFDPDPEFSVNPTTEIEKNSTETDKTVDPDEAEFGL